MHLNLVPQGQERLVTPQSKHPPQGSEPFLLDPTLCCPALDVLGLLLLRSQKSSLLRDIIQANVTCGVIEYQTEQI